MVRSILRVSVVLSIAVCALTARPVWAQITTGTLSGSVRDAQGAVVPGATVTLVSAVRGTTIGLSYIGLLDELSIFNRALAPDEVAAVYRLESGVSGLVR